MRTELTEALVALNELKQRKIIQDYAIGGGYAGIYHEVVNASYDLDVFAIVLSQDSLRVLQPIYNFCDERGYKRKQEHIIIGDMPIQILPNISPLHNSAVEEAEVVKIDGVITKVIGREYLIALSLVAFRHKDKLRIVQLLGKADRLLLERILVRFDNEKDQLRRKYREVLGSA